MKLIKFGIALFLCCLIYRPLSAAERATSWQNDKLRIDAYALQNTGQNIRVLVEFRLLNGWHIFWDNPGDAGRPVNFRWQLPEGWLVEKTRESTPQKFIFNDLIHQYGYGGTAYYLFEISLPKQEKKLWPDIALDLSWTACKDVCEPENAQLDVPLVSKSVWQKQYQKAVTTFPTIADMPILAQNNDFRMTLTFPGGDYDLQTEPFYFIPYERRMINADAPQIKLLNKNKQLQIKVYANLEDFIPSKGLLIYGKKAFVYNVIPLQSGTKSDGGYSLALLLLLAFAGGIVLNCMPCVFPILSIKAFSLAQSSKLNGHIRRGILYLLGVLSCFVLTAFLLYVLRYGGTEAGWGFQLQSPWFIGSMLCLFIFLFLTITDIIKIQGRFLNLLNRYAGISSFTTGFLAVLIASPCTGPFMGAALGYALFQPPHVYFPIFISLGLGYALPFTLAEMYPGVVRKILPKPGKWMNVLKLILSVPIVLTCFWLGWILYNQTVSPKRIENKEMWQPYNEKTIRQQIADGKAVCIDFTAKWCVTCLVNEQLVFDTDAFAELAKENNIVLFKADWTTENPEISIALNKYQRSGVPLYVYYPPQKATGEPLTYVLLPQLLTLNVIHKYLNTQNQDND